MRDSRLLWLWLVPFLLVTFWLGARGLDADALWGDEYFSIADSGGPFTGPFTPAQIWDRIATENPWHAPGFFLLLNQWAKFSGWQPPALRAMSLLFGMLAVAWTYRLGRDFISPRAGLYGALILGTAAFFVHFLHELRMYMIVAALTPFTVWIYLRIVARRREPTLLAWAGLLGGALGLLYTHYFASLILGAIGIYHLLFVRKDARWWRVTGLLLAAGVLFLPWVGVLRAGLQKAERFDWVNERALTAPEITGRLIYLFSNGAAPLLALVAIFALAAGGRRTLRAWFFPLALFALMLTVNQIVQIILAPRVRYLISLWSLLALVAGLGIAQLQRFRPGEVAVGRYAAPLVLALWVGFGIWNVLNVGKAVTVTDTLDGAAYTFPLHRARDILLRESQPGDVVVTYLPDYLSEWMYGGIDRYYYGDLGLTSILVENKNDDERQAEDRQDALAAIADHLRVWIARMTPQPPATLPAFVDALDDSYAYCGTADAYSGLALDLYARSEVCCLPEMKGEPPVAEFGDGVTLADMSAEPTPGDDTLAVLVAWDVDGSVPDYTYSVGLHVVDEDGSLVAQADYGLPPQEFTCQEVEIPLSAVPPGQYALEATVYNWQTGARLPGVVDGGSQQSDLISLGAVRIEGLS